MPFGECVGLSVAKRPNIPARWPRLGTGPEHQKVG